MRGAGLGKPRTLLELEPTGRYAVGVHLDPSVVTVVLLGMLIPIFQTAQGKSEEVRDQLNVQYALYDDATKAEIAELRGELEGISHVASVTFISKAQALKTLEGELKDKTIVEELHSNPLPNSFEVKADDAANLPAIREAVFPNGKQGAPISSITMSSAAPNRAT